MRSYGKWRLSAIVMASLVGACGLMAVPSADAATPVPLSRPPMSSWPDPIPGFNLFALDVGGLRRYYYLETPVGGTKPVPLVVALYGLGGSASWVGVTTGLLADARRAHVALAIPVTYDNAWNDGRFGLHGPKDEAFILGLVKEAVRTKVASPTQVVITGFSNGADMSLMLASRNPHVFSAVVSISGELASAPGSARPTAPIPAYFTHGMADPIQPYGGRKAKNAKVDGLISEDATVAAFAKVNGSRNPKQHMLTPGPAATGDIQQIKYTQSSSGDTVVLYRFPGVGHLWPAAATAKRAKGIAAVGFDASDLIVKVATTQHR